MPRVFLSYRRADSRRETTLIYHALTQHFDTYKDVQNTPLGIRFMNHLKDVIADSLVVLVIIGPSWLNITDKRGRSRLDNPTDAVRIEVETALALGKRIIPVLVGAAEMPAPDALPASLRPLVNCASQIVRSEHFAADMAPIIRLIEAEMAQYRHSPRLRRRQLLGMGLGAVALGVGGAMWISAHLSASTNSPVFDPLPTTTPLTATVRWQQHIGSPVSAGATLDGKTLYVASTDGTLYAIDATTGAIRWRFNVGSALRSTPIVDPTRHVIYVGADDKLLYAIASNGSLLWRVPTPGVTVSSPVLLTDILYLGMDDRNICAFDALSGRLHWTVQVPSFNLGSLAVDQQFLYVCSATNQLFALKLEDGSVAWTYTESKSFASSPRARNGTVYLGGSNGSVTAVNVADGSRQWLQTLVSPDIACFPGLDASALCAISADGILFTLDPLTGHIRWRWESGERVTQTPILNNGIAYVMTSGRLLGFKLGAKTDPLVWQFTPSAAIDRSPVMADGVAYFASTDGAISAITY